MSWPLRVLLALGGSSVVAIAVAALVLGREEPPTATFLVHTAEARSLRTSVVTTEDGTRLRLRFERVSDLDSAIAAREPVGIVIDAETYRDLPRDSLRAWRAEGLVLVAHDVDAAQLTMELEVDPSAPSSTGANAFVLLGGTNDVAGDPAGLDRERPFVGVAYRPPTDDAEPQLGRLGWFQDDEARLNAWLAERALDAVEDYGREFD